MERPFKLIDPSNHEPLVEVGGALQSKQGQPYPWHRFEGSTTTLINFKPLVSVEFGSYEKGLTQASFEGLRPSGKTQKAHYKAGPLKKALRRVPGGGVVLDMGCNRGEVLASVPSSFVKIGVELASRTMFWSDPNILDARPDEIWVVDACRLPCPDNCIDLILCCDILEHLIYPGDLLREALRVLKPGGLLFVTVPNLVNMGNRLSILCGYGSGIELAQILKLKSPFIPLNGPRFPDQDMHLRWFTNSSLKVFVGAQGFRVQSNFGCGPIVSRLGLNTLCANLALLAGLLAQKP